MAEAYAIHTFRYEIFTPQGRVESGETVSVTLPAADGGIGILARRAPVVAQMGAGRMTVRRSDGAMNEYYVAGGFAQVREGALTVLAEECIPAGSLSEEAAAQELERAQALPAETWADRRRRQRALSMAQAKLRLAQEQATARTVRPPAGPPPPGRT
jgi:F-type H+-transporting ATPase subunit epsilon